MTQDLKDMCLIDKKALEGILTTLKEVWEIAMREEAKHCPPQVYTQAATVHKAYCQAIKKALAQDLGGMRIIPAALLKDLESILEEYMAADMDSPLFDRAHELLQSIKDGKE